MKFPYRTVSAITPDLHGFYRISHEAYHDGLGISSSRIKKALMSRAAYTHREETDSSALAFGRAFHAALLEPDLFASRWAVAQRFPGHPNSNEHKAAKEEWFRHHQGREILSADDATIISEMLRTVKSHPFFEALGLGDTEIMAISTCPDTQLKIKCKADVLGAAITDFKTTSSGVRASDFLQDVVKWGYHVSAALYQDIVADHVGERLPFVVVPITNKAPFECEFYKMSDEILDEGRKLYKAGLRRIKRWENESESDTNSKKVLRTLYPNARVLYTTKDTIDFIEGSNV